MCRKGRKGRKGQGWTEYEAPTVGRGTVDDRALSLANDPKSKGKRASQREQADMSLH